MAANGKMPVRYVYDMPFATRQRLCMALDGSGEWKRLAGELGYTSERVLFLGLALQRPGGSPTDDLLNDWGHRNHTVTGLFRYLRDMKYYRGLSILKDLVPEDMYSDLDLCDVVGEGKVGRKLRKVNLCEAQRHTGELPIPDLPHFPIQDQENASRRSKAAENNDDAMNAISYTDNLAYYSGSLDLSPVCETKKDGGEKSMKNEPQRRIPVESSDTISPVKGKINVSAVDVRQTKSGVSSTGTAQLVSELKAMSQGAALISTQHFLYTDIVKATYGFHDNNLLGEGGFGTVYKGILKKTQFAIKRQKHGQGKGDKKIDQQHHMAEIEALLRYRHDNIIQLCGYSMDGPELCLIYQYMENGSLESRLACKNGTTPLGWRRRHRVLTGSARGIQYLHSLDEKPLIHGDIKSANILLDRHFDPKVADFGLAKPATGLGQSGKFTHVSRKDGKVFGSLAYLPDDFFDTYQFSLKTDTYSFGVVIYETCTGVRAFADNREGGQKLKDHIDALWELDNRDEFEHRLRDKKAPDWPVLSWEALMQLGQQCTSQKKRHRPTMQNVLSHLEKIEEDITAVPMSEESLHYSYTSEGQGQNNLAANVDNYKLSQIDHRANAGGQANQNGDDSNMLAYDHRKLALDSADLSGDVEELHFLKHKLELDSAELTRTLRMCDEAVDQSATLKLPQNPRVGGSSSDNPRMMVGSSANPHVAGGSSEECWGRVANGNDDLRGLSSGRITGDVPDVTGEQARCLSAGNGISYAGGFSENGAESMQLEDVMMQLGVTSGDDTVGWTSDSMEITRKCSKKRPQFVEELFASRGASCDDATKVATGGSDRAQQRMYTESVDLYGPAVTAEATTETSQTKCT